MNQRLDDAEEDIERRRCHAGIGQAPRPCIGGGTASKRNTEKRHDERDGQDQGRAGDRRRRRCYGLRADDGMERPEKKRIAKSRRSGSQCHIVEALPDAGAPIVLLNQCFHHPPMSEGRIAPIA